MDHVRHSSPNGCHRATRARSTAGDGPVVYNDYGPGEPSARPMGQGRRVRYFRLSAHRPATGFAPLDSGGMQYDRGQDFSIRTRDVYLERSNICDRPTSGRDLSMAETDNYKESVMRNPTSFAQIGLRPQIQSLFFGNGAEIAHSLIKEACEMRSPE